MYNTFLSSMLPVYVRLKHWSRSKDLEGTEYRVVRRYEDYEAFVELSWTVYEPGSSKHLFYTDIRCASHYAMNAIEKMESGQLQKLIAEYIAH